MTADVCLPTPDSEFQGGRKKSALLFAAPPGSAFPDAHQRFPGCVDVSQPGVSPLRRHNYM